MGLVDMDLTQYENLPIKTRENLVDAVLIVRAGIAKLREQKKQYEQELINLMNAEKIERFEFTNAPEPLVVWRGKKTTNRFDSEKIIQMMKSDQPELRNLALGCLPKNPAFKKTAVKSLMEKTEQELHWEDVEDKIEIKIVPKHIIEKGG